MSFQSWQQTLVTAQADGATLTNSTSATSLLPGAAKFTLPANLLQVGTAMRIRAAGRVSNIVTTPGTLTFAVLFGATSAFSGGAMQLSTTAHTNVPWELEALLTCRTIGNGTNANLMGQARFFSQAANLSGADPTSGHSFLMAPNTAPAVGTGFDSTAAQQVDLLATFSIANSGNAITLHQYVLELLN
jgi:hypothetical protein